jgi:hypothetical protein
MRKPLSRDFCTEARKILSRALVRKLGSPLRSFIVTWSGVLIEMSGRTV